MGSTCNPNAEPGQLVYGDDLGDNILNYLGDNENGVKVGDETSEDEESVGDKVERNDDEFIIGDGVERNEEGEDNEIVGDINEAFSATSTSDFQSKLRSYNLDFGASNVSTLIVALG
ncbi:hypothetical protein ACOSQ2_009781 [Xanthoceras sorbifolium]